MLVNFERRVCGGFSVRPFLAASLTLALLSTASTAFAKPEAGKVSGSIYGGTDFPISGNLHTGAVAPVPNLGALNPALAGVAADLQVGKRSYNRVYDQAIRFGVDLNYGLNESSEVFGSVNHVRSGGGNLQVGNAVVTTTIAGGPAVGTALPIEARFGRYKSTNVEAGYRRYFGSSSLQPYGAVRAGIGFANKINASFAIPAAAIAINNARFYKSSTTFSGGLDLGLSYNVGENAALQLETGLRYSSKLRSDDRDIAALGLASINNSGDRLSVPLTLKLRLGF
jgi:hypothetical protein